MKKESRLAGKKILLVDDEPDVLDSLEDLLPMCDVVKASNFKAARDYLENQQFDMAILDIMGVEGFELLDLTEKIGTPALMLTAHALSSKHLVKSLKNGAYSYIPKHEMADISDSLSEAIKANENGWHKPRIWFKKLMPYFDEVFGSAWRDTHKEDLKNLNLIGNQEKQE